MSTMGNMLHALHVFGASEGNGYSLERILDVVTNEAAAMKRFDGKSPFIRSATGVRIRLVDIKFLSQDFAEAEHHPGQMLSMLGAAGVPLDQRIRFQDGTSTTLKAIRDDLILGFDLHGEIYWQISALAHYLDKTSWTNKYGEKFTFDSAAEELLRRDPNDSPCLGLHKPLTLATLVVLSDNGGGMPLLSFEVRSKVNQYLAEIVTNTEKRQSAAGDWGADWWSGAPTPENPLEREDAKLIARLTATGHLLELFALVGPYLRTSPELKNSSFEDEPRVEVVGRAKQWLGRTLSEKAADARWIDRNYCPVSHAYKSLHSPGR